jgi:1-acyl-sn-glycerol-3-phosphate acyltransferase
MRKILCYLNLVFITVFLAIIALLISPFDGKGETIHRLARLWAKILLKVAGVTLTVEGAEHIGKGSYVIMPNHQSALDIPTLLAALPLSFKFVAKQELFRIPLFGLTIRKAGYISIDRDNPREALKAIEDAVHKIQGGANVLIFPEGTRSPDGKLLPFMKGAFSLAMRAAVPVMPLAIIGTNALQPAGAVIPVRKGRVTVRIGEPIVLAGKGASYKTELTDIVRGSIERLAECPTN